mgnify:CR=1 FL=1
MKISRFLYASVVTVLVGLICSRLIAFLLPDNTRERNFFQKFPKKFFPQKMFSTKNFFSRKIFCITNFFHNFSTQSPLPAFLHWLGASFQLYINEENGSAIISGFRVIPQHLLFSSPQIHFRSICSSPAPHILSS